VANIPTVGVDELLVTIRECDLLLFVADTPDAAAGFSSGEIATVVVTHLDENKVARLHFGENFVPSTFINEGAAAAAGAGAICDVDAGGVEVMR